MDPPYRMVPVGCVETAIVYFGVNASGACRKNDAETLKCHLDKTQRILMSNVWYTAHMETTFSVCYTGSRYSFPTNSNIPPPVELCIRSFD
jgi:hypothetical protein